MACTIGCLYVLPLVVYNGKYYEALTLASLVWSTFQQSPLLFNECVYLHATQFLIRFYRGAAFLLLPLATQVAPRGSVSFLIPDEHLDACRLSHLVSRWRIVQRVVPILISYSPLIFCCIAAFTEDLFSKSKSIVTSVRQHSESSSDPLLWIGLNTDWVLWSVEHQRWSV